MSVYLQIRHKDSFPILRTSPRQVVLDTGDICVFESRHAPGFQMTAGQWAFDKICFVREGTCDLVTPDATTTLKTNDLVCLPAMLEHHFEDAPSAPSTLVLVCFDATTLDAMPGTTAAHAKLRNAFDYRSPLAVSQSHRKDRVTRCLQKMVFEQTTARVGHESAVWGLFLQLVAILARSAEEATTQASLSSGAKAFAMSVSFLEENFTEKIRIESLAAMAGVSYRHYTSLFRMEKGVTVGAYLMGLRVDFAKRRLLETGNIAISGLDAGFDDLSNFYRVFRKTTGTTPGRFLATIERPESNLAGD